MKAKQLSLTLAVLLAAGVLWFAWSAWRMQAVRKPSVGVGLDTPPGPNSDPNSDLSLTGASQARPAPGSNSQTKPGPMLPPPDPLRRFTDFTPEERVEFARKGHGPGG